MVSTGLDFVLDSDPNDLELIQYIGLSQREMPDSRNEDLFARAICCIVQTLKIAENHRFNAVQFMDNALLF
jgi:hypothetical protein